MTRLRLLLTGTLVASTDAQRRFAVRLVAVLAFVGFLSSDMYLSMMPTMTQAMGTSAQWMQLSVGVYLFGVCAAQLVLGPLSDWIGRRPVILSGIVLMAVGSVISAFSGHIAVFLWGRLLVGIGAAGGLAMARVVARDCYRGVELVKASSIFSLVVGLAPAIAPVLGGFIGQYWGWKTIFTFLVLCYSALLLVFWRYFPETLSQDGQVTQPMRAHLRQGVGALLRARAYVVCCLLVAVLFGAYMAYMTASPFIFQEHFQYSLSEYTVVIMSVVVASLVGRVVNILLLRVLSGSQLIALGIMGAAFGALGLLLQSYFAALGWPCLAWVTVFVASCGMVLPNLAAKAMDDIGDAVGLAGAIYGSMQMAGSFVGSVLAALLSAHSMLGIAWVMLLASVLAAVVCYITFKQSLNLPWIAVEPVSEA